MLGESSHIPLSLFPDRPVTPFFFVFLMVRSGVTTMNSTRVRLLHVDHFTGLQIGTPIFPQYPKTHLLLERNLWFLSRRTVVWNSDDYNGT